MRFLLVFVLILIFTAGESQSVIRDNYLVDPIGSTFTHRMPSFDSSHHSKWSFSKYAGVSMGYSFFKGGSASYVSVPLSLQLNRRLTDHVSAFAGVSVAPLYLNFNSAFPNDFTKNAPGSMFNKTGNLGIYSKAELGLMYTNDAKTFSISGSIGVARSSTPVYYPNNAIRQSPVAPSHQ